MNKKIIIKNQSGGTSYCVLSGEKDIKEQLNKWYFNEEHPSHGLKVEFDQREITFYDYFHADIMDVIPIIAIEDTDEDVFYSWKEIE